MFNGFTDVNLSKKTVTRQESFRLIVSEPLLKPSGISQILFWLT